jgi:hypothetical protein
MSKDKKERRKQMTIDVKKNVVYLDNVASFVIMEGGKKEPVTPNGWNMYRNNARDVDEWLITRGQRKASPSGQIF